MPCARAMTPKDNTNTTQRVLHLLCHCNQPAVATARTHQVPAHNCQQQQLQLLLGMPPLLLLPVLLCTVVVTPGRFLLLLMLLLHGSGCT
jgi:hypothetical protein